MFDVIRTFSNEIEDDFIIIADDFIMENRDVKPNSLQKMNISGNETVLKSKGFRVRKVGIFDLGYGSTRMKKCISN